MVQGGSEIAEAYLYVMSYHSHFEMKVVRQIARQGGRVGYGARLGYYNY